MKWENPTLNEQLKHADLTLSFRYYSLSLFYLYIFYNFLPCIKCSARASVISCLAHLKIVR